MISASPRRLNVFKSVVECGGFNLAAIRLGIAQPSVGAHVKALEAQLGQPLFLRHRGARPRLTKAGEAVYAYAVEVLHRSEVAAQTLAELRSAAAQEIVIAVHRDIAPHFLPPRLTAFSTKYPKARVVTRIGTIDEVIELVRSRAVTLGLFLGLGPVPGMRSEILGREPLVLVAAPHHPLAGGRAVPVTKLASYPFVTALHGSRYFKLADAALRKIGLVDYAIAMEVEEAPATKEMLRHGTALACLPRCTVANELAAGTLVELTPVAALQQLELRCAYSSTLSDSGRNFLGCLRP